MVGLACLAALCAGVRDARGQAIGTLLTPLGNHTGSGPVVEDRDAASQVTSSPSNDGPRRSDSRTAPEGLRNQNQLREEDSSSSRTLNELPPDPPTEFQQLVLNSTGRSLPIYGASVFHNVPSTFAPLDRVPVTPGYLIGPGDELLIQIWGQISLDTRLTVDRAGDIYIPQVGSMRVAGLPFDQLQGYLKSQVERVFRNFDLNVNMGQLRSIQIFVLGQARRPGSYTISSLSTLVDAIFETGGPTPQGSLRHIQLKRSSKTIAEFDLYDLLQRGDKSGDMPLLPGDVIYIPPVGPQIAVAGSVNDPAIYELKQDSRPVAAGDSASAVPKVSTVDDGLMLAAGPTSVAAKGKMRLERVEAHRSRSVLELSFDPAGRAIALRDGDILEVVAIVDTFESAVTLRGNVANPGHYIWKPGMKVGQLFPDKDALITRDYWLKRGRMGQPILTYIPACPNGCAAADADSAALLGPALKSNSNTPGIGQRLSEDGANSAASAVVDQSVSRFQSRNDIVLSEPDIDWNYAVIERQSKQNLTTSLLPFNLGRLVLDGDASQDLELLPDDVITIFSKADIRVPQAQQTRLVYLEGEFVSSGVYSVLPGETLRELVKRAGGLSPDAYLYGSEFTRESTRRIQQQRLNEYINQIEARAGLNPDRRYATGQEAGGEAAQSQSLVNSLRQVRSSGRIVLEIKPDTNSAAQIPAMPLEDGDRFIVPQVPSVVNVAGAVYNPNSFLYDTSRRLGSYLTIAGGANRDADARRIYVIRADGSVVSKGQISALHRDGFNSLPIFPGDTIIVPVNLNKGAALRNVVDLSQVVGQLGLALAAAKLVF